jgi:hypothetical protein
MGALCRFRNPARASFWQRYARRRLACGPSARQPAGRLRPRSGIALRKNGVPAENPALPVVAEKLRCFDADGVQREHRIVEQEPCELLQAQAALQAIGAPAQ